MIKKSITRRYSNQSEINKLFNNLYDPELDNLDCLVLYGYFDLTNTEKITYLFISSLFRDDVMITPKQLTNVMRVSRKTINNCLYKLESLNLIEKVRDRVYPMLPNPKEDSFRETMALISE